MNVKEIDKLILENLAAFFKERGFKEVKKNLWFEKEINEIKFFISFSSVERNPKHYYEFVLGAYIEKVENIKKHFLGRTDLNKFTGYTYIFPFSYFLNPNDFINKNPKWEIENYDDIGVMTDEIKDFFEKYLRPFIENNSSITSITNIINQEISTKKEYTLDSDLYIRSLILLYLTDAKKIEEQSKEYVNVLKSKGYIKSEEKVNLFSKFIVEYNKKNKL